MRWLPPEKLKHCHRQDRGLTHPAQVGWTMLIEKQALWKRQMSSTQGDQVFPQQWALSLTVLKELLHLLHYFYRPFQIRQHNRNLFAVIYHSSFCHISWNKKEMEAESWALGWTASLDCLPNAFKVLGLDPRTASKEKTKQLYITKQHRLTYQ